ncbi:MAG: TatD family hydrolase [Verrucomicrobia bacterium]|nr:TatD family hydrolase [Verrucomicrobiota bacterium]
MLYDTHAHLYFDEFRDDLEDVLSRARNNGVSKIIVPGIDIDTGRQALELSGRFEDVHAAVGWHPGDAASAPENLRDLISQLAAGSPVAAIGEIGLDFRYLPSRAGRGDQADDAADVRSQIEVFKRQLDVAAELGLSCIIHQRDSWKEIFECIEPYRDKLRFIFHCFSGDADVIDKALEFNSAVSFTGIITFKNGREARRAVEAVAPGRFMLETDCPFMSPVPFRGRRCEPAFLTKTAELAAELKNCSLEELGEITCETAHNFFRL